MTRFPLSLTARFADLAPGYDVVLSDVWGVVHNGVNGWPDACAALTRFRQQVSRQILTDLSETLLLQLPQTSRLLKWERH